MTMKSRNSYGWTAWAIGLLSLVCIGALLGCSDQDTGSRARAAQKKQPKERLGVKLRSSGESVAIAQVQQDSPAEEAGLQEGDKVIAVNGQPVKSASQVQSQVQAAAERDGKLEIKVRRRQDERVIQASFDEPELAVVPESDEADAASTNPADGANTSLNLSATELEEPETEVDPVAITEEDVPSPEERERAEDSSIQHVAPAVERQDSIVSESVASSDETSAAEASSDVSSGEETEEENLLAAEEDETVVTLQRVERELAEAQRALEGFIARSRNEYRRNMQEKLSILDQRTQQLEQEIQQLENELTDKRQIIGEVRSRRKALLEKMESLDPNDTESYREKRKEIDAAWQSLQRAFVEGTE